MSRFDTNHCKFDRCILGTELDKLSNQGARLLRIHMGKDNVAFHFVHFQVTTLVDQLGILDGELVRW